MAGRKKIAILQFPGSNCERESALAVARAGMEPVPMLWNSSAEALHGMDGYFVVGGFSYEDRSRAGVLAARDPLMEVIRKEANSGKPVLGICNGAQILVEAGLVPGRHGATPLAALARNLRVKDGHVLGTSFYNAWIHVRSTLPAGKCAFNWKGESRVMRIPAAHAEGRFVLPPFLENRASPDDLGAFLYVDASGNALPGFPVNPNGSYGNLAALTNPAGNVMAMMPHPERVVEGDSIFHSMRLYLEDGCPATSAEPIQVPEGGIPSIAERAETEGSVLLVVGMVIQDNTASSVRSCLDKMGFSEAVQRRVVWEITSEDGKPPSLDSILQTGELLNPNKEFEETRLDPDNASGILVWERQESAGPQKLEHLQNRFGIKGIRSIRKGTLWFTPNTGASWENLLKTGLFANPWSQKCERWSS